MKPFYSDCVGWPDDVDDLIYLQDESEEISRARFLKLVDKDVLKDIEAGLGYNRALKMKDDYHVRYHLHEPTGIPYFVHSAIEHVFATRDDIAALHEMRLTALDKENASFSP